MRALSLVLLLLTAPVFAAAPTARFDWFEYRGDDAAFAQPLPPGHYRNPVLAGFHADPSVVAANGRFYLVNSSFAWFPGIPVFESRDLVHWTQIGNVIDRPGQLDFEGLGMSRGIFAPAISHHAGRFHVVTTAVDSGGTFIASAADPAGPWSDPQWLPQVGGIDPSLFFDDDGQAYLVHNDAPPGTPRYDGHRAIWLWPLDATTLQPSGPRTLLLDGGVKPDERPIWIEGPHLYRRAGWYYLSAAEGGTGPQHSQVVLRSRHVRGPYTAHAGNPILTQRDLLADRALPVTNTGHADLVEGPDGRWWALFLASRAYDRAYYNTGRETFLLPVSWRDGWPLILERGATVPYTLPGPGGMHDGGQAPNSGNFSWRDDFDTPVPGLAWLTPRVPKHAWMDLHSTPGTLVIHPLHDGLDSLRNPAFLARRQQHLRFAASTSLAPPAAGVRAGLAAFQNERYWYFLGARRDGAALEVFLQRRAGDAAAVTLARQRVPMPRDALALRITGDGGDYGFAFDRGDGWQSLADHQDGRVLSTEVAGGFVGAMLGPFAQRDATP